MLRALTSRVWLVVSARTGYTVRGSVLYGFTRPGVHGFVGGFRHLQDNFAVGVLGLAHLLGFAGFGEGEDGGYYRFYAAILDEFGDLREFFAVGAADDMCGADVVGGSGSLRDGGDERNQEAAGL